jgi:RNA polymerase sigma-70 factor (ECF subfamily)
LAGIERRWAPFDPTGGGLMSSSETDNQETDEALMLAFRGGDAEAFQRLVNRHSKALYNFVLRNTRDAARAEELLQEILLRVVRSKERYQRTARFTTWVYTIARNLCVDEARRARHRRHESLDAPRSAAESGERTMLSGLASEELATDERTHGLQMRERLRQAFAALPDDQREVFLMRQVAGLSFREIADAIGAPENTAKSRMRYALEKLRSELADLHFQTPSKARRHEESFVHG